MICFREHQTPHPPVHATSACLWKATACSICKTAAFFSFHCSIRKKPLLHQTVDVLGQAFTVVEGHIF